MDDEEFRLHKAMIVRTVNQLPKGYRIIICHNPYTEEQERRIDEAIAISKNLIIGRVPRTPEDPKKAAERLTRLILNKQTELGMFDIIVLGQLKPKVTGAP